MSHGIGTVRSGAKKSEKLVIGLMASRYDVMPRIRLICIYFSNPKTKDSCFYLLFSLERREMTLCVPMCCSPFLKGCICFANKLRGDAYILEQFIDAED